MWSNVRAINTQVTVVIDVDITRLSSKIDYVIPDGYYISMDSPSSTLYVSDSQSNGGVSTTTCVSLVAMLGALAFSTNFRLLIPLLVVMLPALATAGSNMVTLRITLPAGVNHTNFNINFQPKDHFGVTLTPNAQRRLVANVVDSCGGNCIVAESLPGMVYTPGDANWSTMGPRTFSAFGSTYKPLAVVYPNNEDQLLEALTYAKALGLKVGVRSGGHTTRTVRDGALTIDLRSMCTIRYDPVTTYVTVGTACSAEELLNELIKYGRYTPAATNSEVGVGGWTLLGGLGFLTRKYGVGCDNVVAYRMMKITTGEVINVTANSNPELFWGLSGAGVYFGIVIELTIKTFPAPNRVYTGELRWDGTTNNGQGYRAALRAYLTLRDQLRVTNNRQLVLHSLFVAPPGGHVSLVFIVAFDGPRSEVGTLLDPLLNLNPDYNSLKEDIFPNSLRIEVLYTPDDLPSLFWGRYYRDDIDLYTQLDNAAQYVLQNPGYAWTFEDLQGGAMDELPSDYNAYGWRPAPRNGALLIFVYIPNGNYTEYIPKLQQFPNQGPFVNTFNTTNYANYYLSDIDINGAFSPEKVSRIRALVAQYDPNAVLIPNAPPQLII
eukprot:TRINITY_DN8_c0_g2_i1.p1 TRINITY_DN8_c0_g2~~TRINITY_DN8_c0_g2_i1.p1  ORF type:complete len:668 (+),score=66.25 TRINITY_DN8_c0_g2_i1:190-2004(+)